VIDLRSGERIPNAEIKQTLASLRPYREWIEEASVVLADLPSAEPERPVEESSVSEQLSCFGYTEEELSVVLKPLLETGEEGVGSMGSDTPLAVFSGTNPLLYSYFKQLFAQVTNPPLDAIREELVTSLTMYLGCSASLFGEGVAHCRKIVLSQPVLTKAELAKIQAVTRPALRARTISLAFDVESEEAAITAFERRLSEVLTEANQAVSDGVSILVLS
ncbi:MAG: glutamate synthase subunit alpha, partial [Actinobacteria bacterium]|nr:glutamate synthase subunit alpha [Actinomycetota bacterium]